MRLVFGFIRVFAIDAFNFEQREETFLFLGRADLPGNQIAGLQIETADLGR